MVESRRINSWTDRRTFLRRAGCGFGMLAFLDLLAREGGAGPLGGPAPRRPHHPATARSVIHLFMSGGPSQVDLFDPKPELQRRDGQPWPCGERPDVFFGSPGPLMASPFGFQRHGQSGQWVSELLPHLAGRVDEIAFLKGMHADSNNHAPAVFQMNTGRTRSGHPSLGSWAVYGLGSENQDLPGFVVLSDRRAGPIGGPANWGSGFLPASVQATPLRPEGDPILHLKQSGVGDPTRERRRADLLDVINHRHLAEGGGGEPELLARVAAGELAFRMQAEAPVAVDLRGESSETKRLYGLDDPVTEPFGRQLLLARRLVERGVRFVQVYSGGGTGFATNWDAHDDLMANHRARCAEIDRPVAGLLIDLKRRGLLDETLVLWGGEFGRMPVSQTKFGRDHNPHGFTAWMAGGGVRGGVAHGETDEFGHRAIEGRCHVNDWHATILHLIGLDHTLLTHLHAGREERLTDVGGEVINPILRQMTEDG